MASPNSQGFHQGGPPRYNQGGNFSQNHDQGWRSHPGNNFHRNQGVSSNHPLNQGLDLYERTTKLENTLTRFMQVSLLNHKSTESANRNLEVQVGGQLAKQLAKTSISNFMADTEKNPKEECKVIFTRRESAEKEKRIEGVLEDVSDEEGEEKKREEGEKEKK